MIVFTDIILGVFEMPDYEEVLSTASIPLTVVFNNVREPRELGTLLHSASAVGCQQIITLKGTVYVSLYTFVYET